MNIGSEVEVSIMELATEILELTGSTSRILNLPPLAEGDMPRRQPDSALMRAFLDRGFIPLREGLSRILNSPPYAASKA